MRAHNMFDEMPCLPGRALPCAGQKFSFQPKILIIISFSTLNHLRWLLNEKWRENFNLQLSCCQLFDLSPNGHSKMDMKKSDFCIFNQNFTECLKSSKLHNFFSFNFLDLWPLLQSWIIFHPLSRHIKFAYFQ